MNLTIWTEEQVAQIREALESVQNYFPSMEESEARTHDGLAIADVAACQKALALLVPTEVPESATDVVHQIVEIYSRADDDSSVCEKGIGAEDEIFEKALVEATALIYTYARQVLGAMLEEITDMGDPCINDIRRERLDAIAAKYNVTIEEDPNDQA